MKATEKVYSPPRYLYYFLIAIFLFVLFLIYIIEEISFTTIALSCFEIIIIISLIELFKSNMRINDSEIIINGLFKNKIINLSEIKEVKMQDHELYIFLNDNKKLDLPFWFPSQKSLYLVIKDRLKAF
jgi:hypothetical protein